MRIVSVEERAKALAEREGLTIEEARFEVAIGAGLTRGDVVVLDERGRRVRYDEPSLHEVLADPD